MILGIDISKNKFDVALLKDEKFLSKVFSNKPSGFLDLQEWLSKLGVKQLHACLEATGTYGEALCSFLHSQRYIVSVINPAAIKAFAKSYLTRNKTDKVDAQVIARYCLSHQPPIWTAPSPAIKTLQSLVRRLEALIQMQQEEKNRLAAGIDSQEVNTSLEVNITFLEQQIKHIKGLIKKHIDSDAELKTQNKLLLQQYE